MIINLSPQVSSKELVLSVDGDVLTVNGQELDFSVIPDGATLPADAVDNEFIIGSVERIGGVIRLTTVLPITYQASASARFPSSLNQTSGQVELPS
ncbi:hypothetical protein [Methylophaga sp.]|uniref:hypothetical protein n=1 Tax=Methylophaga sp. TaxID=2024840 RepID=UPI003A95C660